MTVKLARKKPVEVEFEIWSGVNYSKIKSFVGTFAFLDDNNLIIRTLEGDMHASIGDYILKVGNGEFYICKPDIFEKTYTLVEETPKRYVFNPTPEDMDKANELGYKINAEVVRLIEKYSVEYISKAFEGLELGDE